MNNEFLQECLKIINRYNDLNKKVRSYGTDGLLYPSEIHVIDAIGTSKDMTTTKLAAKLGITKGGISQITSKLIKKNLISKEDGDGLNEVYLILTDKGMTAYQAHIKLHEPMVNKVNSLFEKMDESSKNSIINLINEISSELSRLEELE